MTTAGPRPTIRAIIGGAPVRRTLNKTFRTITPFTRTLMRLLPAVPAGIVLSAVVEGRSPGEIVVRYGFPLAAFCAIAYVHMRSCHTIELRDDQGAIEFKTFLGARMVPVREIASISPGFVQRNRLIIRYAGGSVAIPGQFAGLHDMLEWIRRQNPSARLGGI